MNVNFNTFMKIDSDSFLVELQKRHIVSNWDALDLQDVILQMDNIEYVNDADILGFAIQLATTAKDYVLSDAPAVSNLITYTGLLARLINDCAVSKQFCIESIVM